MTRVMKLLGKHRALLALSLLCAAISSLLTLAVPLLVGRAIDAMIENGKGGLRDEIVRIAIWIGACTVVSALAQWIMNVLNNRMSYALVYRLRRDAFQKIHTNNIFSKPRIQVWLTVCLWFG